MRHPLFQKCALLFIISLLLMLPLSMIQSAIDERTEFRNQATHAIAAATAGEQTITGPILVFPVDEYFDEERTEKQGKQIIKRIERYVIRHRIAVKPKQLDFNGDMKVEKRAYGLYDTNVFSLQEHISGRFETPDAGALTLRNATSHLVWGSPALVLGIEDPRGIDGEPKVMLDGQALQLRQGVRLTDADMKLPQRSSGVREIALCSAKGDDERPEDNVFSAGHAAAAAFNIRAGFRAVGAHAYNGKTATLPFTITLTLSGTASLKRIPLGEVTTAELRADWPHPSFGGNYLPRSREVGEQGFTARWSATALAADGIADNHDGFQVSLINPVDIYQQATRAVKYGILFITLGFAAFFAFEHLRTLPIHPIQYLLVGLAQAIFFLLLVSLSEHIRFWLAYLVSAAASIALITVYLAAILKGWRRALGFSLAQALLYAALFGILRAEQNALLLGSLLLFAALAGLMIGTRRIDWYGLGQNNAPRK